MKYFPFIIRMLVIALSGWTLMGMTVDAGEGNERMSRSSPDLMNPGDHAPDSSLAGYDVHWYFPDLEVNDTNTFIRGKAEVMATVVSDTLLTWTLQLTDSLTVDSVKFNGITLPFTHASDLLIMQLPYFLLQGDMIDAKVFYHGTVPTGGFFSAMTSKEDDQWKQRVTWTLSEPFVAMDWFPCKQDLTDKADSCAVWVTVDSSLYAGSNGVLQYVDTLSNGSRLRYRWNHHHPIDYYLISLAVSDYRVYDLYAHLRGVGGDSLLIRNLIYRDPAYLAAEKEHIDRIVPIIELFSRLFTTYPFADEKYGHSLAPMGGGMEHQTMSTIAGFGFTVIAHELAHQWFGDHVTCATWQDIWINEGFASYAEYLALGNLESRKAADDWMTNAHVRAMKEPDGSVYIPFEDAGNISRIFNYNLSYKKGASFLHMIRYELADDSLFFAVLRAYQKKYADSVATGKDFEHVLEAVSGKDFKDFFDQWYDGKGYPRESLSWFQDRDSLFIRSIQTPSGSTPLFKMHFDILIHSDSGDTLVRVFQKENNRLFVIPFRQPVLQVIPDPHHWMLMEVSSVSHVISPGDREGNIVLYPNPAQDEVFIYPPVSIPEMNIKIMDIKGKTIAYYRLIKYPYRLDVSKLPQGIYLFRIESGKNAWVKKFIKIR